MDAPARRARWIAAATAAVAAALVLALALLARAPAEEPVSTTLTLARALGGADTAGYLRATAPRDFAFPADHGPHDGFRTEWWYFTGNVSDARGRRFGYQLTFFRNALRADTVERASAWAADVAFMAHFALADVDGGGFHADERFARAALGLAGARLEPFRVWTGDWAVEGTAAARGGVAAPDAAGAPRPKVGQPTPATPDEPPFPLRLRAATPTHAIDLVLAAGKPPVPQGERGLSRKGGEPGNASFYYSMTRMPTAGSVVIAGDTFDVRGESWMDREWSTSVLPDGVIGWDWFALQFDDTTELMLYQLRDTTGAATPFSAGAFIAHDGRATTLGATDFEIDARDTWASPIDGSRYPAAWRVRVPRLALDIEVRPLLADQEMGLTVRYWEGAVAAAGSRAGRPLRGRGYVELTGYAR